MILVDTSVWVDHLRRGDPGLARLLEAGAVLCHPWVVGELALGRLDRRDEILGLLTRLPTCTVASPTEVLVLVDRFRLMGRGIGYVDVQLLAATKLTPDATLWTHDKKLAAAATDLGVAADPALIGTDI
ncbi:type II toxin-antitoxin system VapC family toxin [Nakamurella sp. GG22]